MTIVSSEPLVFRSARDLAAAGATNDVRLDAVPQFRADFGRAVRRARAPRRRDRRRQDETPEFGAGSQTFNALFGATLNPYDLTKTCGGSSGGAAVPLACGMLPLADGTDLGGSLRNLASFCNVVGFRPSPGRVPRLDSRRGDTLGVHGPMARSVDDLALLGRLEHRAGDSS